MTGRCPPAHSGVYRTGVAVSPQGRSGAARDRQHQLAKLENSLYREEPMAIQHLPTYAETTAMTDDASSSSREARDDQALAITIDTRRGDVIEWNKKQTVRERESFFMSIIGLVVGGWVYLFGSLAELPAFRTMALVPIVLSLLEPAGVARVGLAFVFGITRRKPGGETVVSEPPVKATAVVDNPPDDPALIQYKEILRSILPPEFLSPEGFLRTATGTSQQISIQHSSVKSVFSMAISLLTRDTPDLSIPAAAYYGPLAYRVLLHRLTRSRKQIELWEFQTLHDFATQQIGSWGPKDIIDIRRARHRGVLAHETFHDIQAYLYENHPDVIEKLQSASYARRSAIEQWYNDPANKQYSGPDSYRLEHFFPTRETASPYGTSCLHEWLDVLSQSARAAATFPSIAAIKVVDDAHQDLGRNELIPTLVSAATEGSAAATAILAGIFEEAGLNKDFCDSMPQLDS
jgi:hypothetical protein